MAGVMGSFYLGWRYLRHHPGKTTILISSITLIAYLPVGLSMLVDEGAQSLRARAAATPLLLGARGSPVELTLNSLYFSTDTPALTHYAALDAIEPARAQAIPLYVRHQARRHPIVGTSLDYLDYRALTLAQGRGFAVLGEAVLGAQVATALDVGVGDSVVSSPETVFDLAGVYPLKMPVVGVLAPGYSQDDRAIFVDVKTAWVIQGLGHGHQDLARPESAAAVLKKEGDRIVANAALVQYNEITADNVDSFHFHGDRGGNPLTAILPAPVDDKARVLIQGRYQSHPQLQVLQPRAVMDELLATVFAVQRYVLVAMAMVGTATAAVVLLVFLLSLRARRAEMETMSRLGGSSAAIGSLMLAEMVIVLLSSVLLAALLSAATLTWGGPLLQAVVMN